MLEAYLETFTLNKDNNCRILKCILGSAFFVAGFEAHFGVQLAAHCKCTVLRRKLERVLERMVEAILSELLKHFEAHIGVHVEANFVAHLECVVEAQLGARWEAYFDAQVGERSGAHCRRVFCGV
jgi:hypothetical protein